MVAPIDAKAVIAVGEEEFTLRLNFRALSSAKRAGVNLMDGSDLDPLDMAIAVRCMAEQDHPGITDEDAFAILMRGEDAASAALDKLFEEFSASAEGNAPKGKGKKQAAKRRT